LQNGQIPERFPALPLPQPFPSAEWHGRAYHFLINKATTSNYIHFFIRRQPELWHPRMTNAFVLLPFVFFSKRAECGKMSMLDFFKRMVALRFRQEWDMCSE
jgi:hypothetical protein